MNTFNKNHIVSFLLLASVVSVAGWSVFATPAMAANDVTLSNPLCPSGALGDNCVDTFGKLITKIIKFISEVVGALAVLMLVVAGIFFVLAGAKPENVTRAKQIAIYAVLGLAIALAGTGLVFVVEGVIVVPPTAP